MLTAFRCCQVCVFSAELGYLFTVSASCCFSLQLEVTLLPDRNTRTDHKDSFGLYQPNFEQLLDWYCYANLATPQPSSLTQVSSSFSNLTYTQSVFLACLEFSNFHFISVKENNHVSSAICLEKLFNTLHIIRFIGDVNKSS